MPTFTSTDDEGGHGANAPLPTLVIAQSDNVGLFRKEWPAADCNPRQAAGDLIEPILSSLLLPRSVIVVSTFIGPGWLPEQLGSLHKAGIDEDDED